MKKLGVKSSVVFFSKTKRTAIFFCFTTSHTKLYIQGVPKQTLKIYMVSSTIKNRLKS